MDAAPEDVPEELKDAWSKLQDGQDAKRLRKHLPFLQQSLGLVKGLESSFQDAFADAKPDVVDPATRAKVRTALVASVEAHSLSMGAILKEFSHLSSDGQGAVRKILEWIAERFVHSLTTFASHLALQSWSVSAGVSTVPPGASFTITITFA